jgi:hypothetical protein
MARYGITVKAGEIFFTCAQCGYLGVSHRWYMTCPRCWVPMIAGSLEPWYQLGRKTYG